MYILTQSVGHLHRVFFLSHTCSIDLVRAVMLAYEVPLEDMESFMKELSEGRCGMSLVFMYHSDALASGHSYQNNAHIKMADHIEVCVG